MKRKAADKRKSKAFPIAGIGASAGGLEAISSLLQHMPGDLGIAYVVIQHLSPSHISILPELLQKHTQMPVKQVEDGMKIEPDHVYVIPPDTFMSVVDGILVLSNRVRKDGGHHAIDHFLTTLAEVHQTHAIGIILSGTGSDGTAGIQIVKAEGGITFAQDTSAAFQGMPRSAIEAGFVDFVLPPEEIAKELTVLSRYPYISSEPEEEGDEMESELRRIFLLLHHKTGVDFAHYKPTTIRRRVLRRMTLARLMTLPEYTKRLREEPAEIDLLYKDLLINVTTFFREPSQYQALAREIFPVLLRNRKPTDPIRIWVPACSTGEEACSIAICLFEYLGDNAINTPIQIFATDLSENAIEKARQGVYPKSALVNVSPQRMRRFFVKLDGHYQIIKAVRDICIFATHNLLKDPPFSRMDLVSCQNVMIYLEASAQKRIVQSFHYALKPEGYLLLGKSETIGSETDLFSHLEKDFKIYAKKDSGRNPHITFSARTSFTSADDSSWQDQHTGREPSPAIDIEKETDKVLLSRYVPASVVVNKDLQIIRFYGNTFPYLQPATGKASLHLLKMVRDELLFELRSLVHRAKKENGPVRKEGVQLHYNSGISEIALEAVLVKSPPSEQHLLIVFHEGQVPVIPAPVLAIPPASKDAKDRRIVAMELELREGREHIKSLSEEFEATREELQSANEEVLSSNEELQSINEELETSKEELQSTNEELTTINEELQLRNADLQESVGYAVSIVETLRTPLIVLLPDLRVRTANKAFYNTFRLTHDETEGAYLFEIGNGLLDVPELRRLLQKTVSKGVSFNEYELRHSFPGIGEKVFLLNAARMTSGENGKRPRTLLVLEDITSRSNAVEAERWLASAVRSSSDAIISFDLTGKIISWNAGAERIFGYSAKEATGQQISMLAPGDVKEKQTEINAGVSYDSAVQQMETTRKRKDGQIVPVSITASGVTGENGEMIGVMAVIQNISRRKQAEAALLYKQQQLEIAQRAARVGIWAYDLVTREGMATEEWRQLTGYKTDSDIWQPEKVLPLLHPDDRQLFVDAHRQAVDIKGSIDMELRLLAPDGGQQWILLRASYVPPQGGNNATMMGSIIDITELKRLEQQKDEFIAIASHELRTPVTSIKAYTEVLRDMLATADDKQPAELISKLDAQVDKLTDLMGDLLDVTRIAEGQLKLQTHGVDLNKLIVDCVDTMRPIAPKHRFVLELGPLKPVTADPERIGQVLTNVISNAIKYSPAGGEVRVISKEVTEGVRVDIQDQGIGMSDEMQTKVFERFYRVNTAQASTFPGLGLGLYIASEIIKRHGGTIGVSSKIGSGALFYFTLPYTGRQ